MAGGQYVGAKIAGGVEQIGEFDELVASDARHRRFAIGVAFREAVDHLLAKTRFVIQHEMRNAEALGNLAGVLYVLPGAAGALAMRRLAMVIELQGHADDIVAAVLQQGRDDARVDAARHGDHDARVGRSLASDQGLVVEWEGGHSRPNHYKGRGRAAQRRL